MNTYIEVTDECGVNNYCYATLDFADEQLSLNIKQGLIKTFKKNLDLAKIKEVVTDTYLGGEIISFYHDEERYTFFECGKGVMDYLQMNLNI